VSAPAFLAYTLSIKFLDEGERGEGGVLHIFQFFYLE